MAACARLASRARPLARPNPGVAAVVVSPDGKVQGRGWTAPGGRPHAEAAALASLAPDAVHSATLYVTLEPCAHQSPRGPACADLIAAARPARVVIGQRDPDPRTAGQGIARLEAAGIATTLLDDAAAARSLAGFLTRQQHGRPFVTLKLAMSLDGCIALADGTSQWITGDAARAHVHAVRARHDAILVGGGTWRSDQPRLDVRLPGLEQRSPRRAVLTSGAVPADVTAIAAPQDIAGLDGVLYLYVEGGAATAAAFLAADLVDELHLYRAPIVIGDGLRAVGPLGLGDLASAHGRWHLCERRQLGSDTFEAYGRTGI
ncbi:MAG: bifunctional diaminohydroxyphosphoribosylaminopyrimidine deaminase/5-amino-6-(5-phosphoribosylamino)uracil reductase RibD [Porphyrobacter sp.]|jgi:diaminohydroxyphosphoribosylaminopyrimidine deaminase/5-amino-6-(5-phosphoribosylamino)uracil reductase|nr:bifunctional diaminohydroxyphosphoribosylaminopyrimidine deaminase/5-amino-6-(5-phosphoribosylamino)uracil reductase RibD [Porphyrobacter sp.]